MEVDKNSIIEKVDVWVNGNRFRAVKIDGVEFNVIKDIADHFGNLCTHSFLKSLPDSEIKKLSSNQVRNLGYPFSSHGLNTISQTATVDYLKKIEKRRKSIFLSVLELNISLDAKRNQPFDKWKYFRMFKHRINEEFEFEQLYTLCCGVNSKNKK